MSVAPVLDPARVSTKMAAAGGRVPSPSAPGRMAPSISKASLGCLLRASLMSLRISGAAIVHGANGAPSGLTVSFGMPMMNVGSRWSCGRRHFSMPKESRPERMPRLVTVPLPSGG